MSIVPKYIKRLMTTMRPAQPDEEPFLEREGQKEARLDKQLQNDRQRGIVNRNRQIKRAESMLARTKDKGLKGELKQQINKLENENRQEQRFLT